MKLLSILLLALYAFAASAQTPKAVIEGREWIYKAYDFGSNYDMSIKINGDTIVDDIACKKLLYKKDTDAVVVGYIYETNKGQVYIYCENNSIDIVPNATFLNLGKWVKTNDFSLEVGDYITHMSVYGSDVFEEDTRVLTKDTIIVKGTKKAKWTTQESDSGIKWSIVEGIGNSKYGIFCYLGYRQAVASRPTYYFKSCNDNGVCIFGQGDFNAPSVTGIKDINAKNQDNEIIYDLQGRKHTSPTTKGLYIKNDKKVIK